MISPGYEPGFFLPQRTDYNMDSCLPTPPNRKRFGEDPGRRNDGEKQRGRVRKCDSRGQPDLTGIILVGFLAHE